MKKHRDRRSFLPLYLGIFIVILDAVSKYFTQYYLPVMNYDAIWYPYGGIGIFHNILGVEFSITHATNRGAAWGTFAEFQTTLLVLRMLCILGIILYLLVLNKDSSWNLPCALIIAGAIGNVLDYFIYGHVIDMLHFVLWGYSYPIFNLADSAIFIGIFWLFVHSLLSNKKKRAA